MSKSRKAKSGRWSIVPPIKHKKAITLPILKPSQIPTNGKYLITGFIFEMVEQGAVELRRLIGHTTSAQPELTNGLILPHPRGNGQFVVTSRMYVSNEKALVEMLSESEYGQEMLKLVTVNKGVLKVPPSVFFAQHVFPIADPDTPQYSEGVDAYDCCLCNGTHIGFVHLQSVQNPKDEIPDVMRAVKRRESQINMTELLSYGIVSNPNISLWDALKNNDYFDCMCNDCRVREIANLTENDILGMFMDDMQSQQ